MRIRSGFGPDAAPRVGIRVKAETDSPLDPRTVLQAAIQNAARFTEDEVPRQALGTVPGTVSMAPPECLPELT
jgi:hypothetical protein